MLTKALISSHTPRILYRLIFSTEEGLGIAKILVQHFSGNQVEGGHGRLAKKMVGPPFSVHAWRPSRSCISVKAVQPESAFLLLWFPNQGWTFVLVLLVTASWWPPSFTLGLYRWPLYPPWWLWCPGWQEWPFQVFSVLPWGYSTRRISSFLGFSFCELGERIPNT